MSSKRKAADPGQDYISARKQSRLMIVPNHPERPKIVSHIPVPVERRGGLRKHDHFYPFEEMKVGGSFWVPSSTGCTPGAVTKFAKKSGWKFVTRAQTEAGEPNINASKCLCGTRVWRIA